ncbi:Universal stress protein UspA and related nucleotide-binding proteins [Variovorax sp. HW608]|uniref:universal stress protein n=1 Tax=Variovorax sp. HW608 TaxID=1034889 RepID=UPI00081FC21A|nr:universal stress protein [Variovorax sp. HW608]SCK58271.1 Universal stress protein UspA and related nucleotide-binding proteins [Variovorax sp. HW608]
MKKGTAVSYKTILVHLDNSSRCAARIAFTAALAHEHDAHVVGLLPTGLYEGSIPAGAIDTGAGDFIAESAAYLKQRAEGIAETFRTQMKASRSVSFELRQVDGLTTDALIEHGRTSDLVVLGQEGGGDRTDTPSHGLVGEVMLGLGRPVAVVPYAGEFKAAPRRVMVAWNGSRESALALGAALPVLSRADQVTLLHVAGKDDTEDARPMMQLHLAGWLDRHGIAATVDRLVGDVPMSDALLSRLCDLQSDMLVMGGYGHSRVRELVLGGMTREILAHMTVPVLMAH